MEKRYIPTTSLNFNNILSSESISPKSFYYKRGFGYNRWFSIPENNMDNVILLYKSLSSFVRQKDDMEDHPLLIEVCLDEEIISSLIPINESLDCSDHTIYLTPWNTRFIFFSEDDKKVALSLSESSLETKLVRLYLKHIMVENPSNKLYDVIPNFSQFQFNEQEMEFDQRIDRMKGLLYGYYIGTLLSASLASIKRLNMLREIQNIYAAVLSDERQQLTEKQFGDLGQLRNELWKETELYRELKKLLDVEDEKLFQIRTLFIEDGYKKGQDLFFCRNFRVNKLQQSDMLWIEKCIEDEESRIKREQNFLSPEDSEIVVIDRSLENISDHIIPNEVDRNVFKMWINEILSLPQYNGKVSTFKEDLSDKATIAAKNVYGEKWTTSSACSFLNSLRRHVRGEGFYQSWNNDIYSSVAAVITNGNDWGQLLHFMQKKGMYDYRLAFAMYGTLNGFANLTRDFTDTLYLCNREYVESVYKEFYGQLFGKSIKEYSEDKVDNNVYCVTSESKLFESLFRDEDFLKMKNGAQQYYRTNVLQLYRGKFDEEFWKLVKKLMYSKTKTKWQQIVKKWQNAMKESQIKKERNEEQNLFSNIESPERSFILSLNCIKELSEESIERLIENFKYSARQDKREDHIRYFHNICLNEGKGEKKDGTKVKNRGLRGVYTMELGNKVKGEIENRYDEYLKLRNQ